MTLNPYEMGLEKTPANYVPLTPLTFLSRSAYIYPERTAVIHDGDRHRPGVLVRLGLGRRGNHLDVGRFEYKFRFHA